MKRKLTLTSICCIASLMSAISTNTLAHPGVYVEGLAGDVLLYIDGNDTNDATIVDPAWGLNANVGYDFGRRWSIEFGYQQIFSGYSNEDKNDRYDRHGFDLAGRYQVPIAKRINFIVKMGAGYNMWHDSDGYGHIFLPYLGIGANVAITQHISFTAQLSGYTIGIAGFGVAGMGLSYHF
jgi:hypothetical protein